MRREVVCWEVESWRTVRQRPAGEIFLLSNFAGFFGYRSVFGGDASMHWGAQWEWEETRVRLGARGCRNFWSFCHRDMEVFPAIILTERPS